MLRFVFFFQVAEKNLPRKTVSLVVALVSPTLLEATHSYMASSRGVRNGWILSTEPEPSSNSITCRCERQDMLKEILWFTTGEGPSAEQNNTKKQMTVVDIWLTTLMVIDTMCFRWQKALEVQIYVNIVLYRLYKMWLVLDKYQLVTSGIRVCS